MAELRFLIVSDLHIGTHEDYNNSTRLTVDTPEMPANENPFEALKEYIKSNALSFNAVINLGDVSNKGFIPGWILGNKMLRELASLSQCPLLSTPGNHDYCFGFEGGAKSLLMRTNNYPTDNKELNTVFWGKGFCLYETVGAQFLILNSENHLSKIDDLNNTPDFERFDNSDLENLLKSNNFEGPRIAILHHHVITHSDLQRKYSANDIMDHADKLLKILNNHNFICVLHGHKHLPRFTLYNNLCIMACGSISSLENISTCDEDNYFHILTLNSNEDGIRGKIETFHFIFQKGWFEIEDSHSRVKPRYGFGRIINIKEIANQIISLINPDAPVISLFDQKVVSLLPEVTYISDEEMQELQEFIIGKGYNVQETRGGLVIYK